MRPLLSLLILLQLLLQGCENNHVDESEFPEEVSAIMATRCATAGCHNAISYGNAGGIDLSSWRSTFDFGRAGSSVIPHSTEYSYLLYFVNTDSSRGPALLPTMPLDLPPLSSSEYQILSNWIRQGAPDKYGRVRYPLDPARKKTYVCMQGCDQVAVIDAVSNNIMRYVKVGQDDGLTESPHMVRVSPDGQFWYVVFYSGSVLQKFRTSDDSLVGSVTIGAGDWNTVIITPDGSRGFVNGTNAGTTAVVNLNTMTKETNFSAEFPHGGFITPDGRWLYLTAQIGNYITKVDISDPSYPSDRVVLQTGESVFFGSRYDSHEMILTPDGSRYLVSCQTSNEIRVLQTSNDSLLAVLPVGEKPQEFTVSLNRPYVYVTCTEEAIDAARKGKVYVIDYTSLNVVNSIYTGYQPHGIACDNDRQLVYVAHLNIDQNGPAPHHVSTCGGRNGYITCIDEQTGALFEKSLPNGAVFQYRQEVLTAPYFVSYKR